MTAGPTPRFVCVGIEKCGTTTLHALLDQRPDVYLGRFKEHFYFNRSFDEGPEWYADRYSTWDGEPMVGDITPSYFRHPQAYDRIHDTLGPDVMGLLVVRHPLVRAWSHYVHQLCHDAADGSFAENLTKPLPGVDPVPVIEGFQAAFGDRGLILVYEDDIAPDPLIGYQKVCAHLDLPPVAVDAPWSNQGVFPRWQHLRAGDTVGDLTVRADALVFCSRNRLVKVELDPSAERLAEVQAQQQTWTRSLDIDEAELLTGRHFPHVVIAAEELLDRPLPGWRTLPEIPSYDDAAEPTKRLTHLGVLGRISAPSDPTFSTFGGNWIDTDTFGVELARRVDAGEVDTTLAEHLTTFERDGRVVLTGAVDDDVIDRVHLDLEGAWLPESGYLARNNLTGLMPAHLGRGQGRLIDAHMNSEAIRDAAFAPAILDFLHTLFDDDVVAFQSLYFESGSQQSMHLDTAYVVTDEPLRIAAAWISLEDIEPGTGELQYYPGSHRHDPYLFSGRFRSWNRGRDGENEHDDFIASIKTNAEQHGVEAERFLPACGDALIWHADLAHGGTPITARDSTRHSVVVHYAPRSSRPNYARRGNPYPVFKATEGGFVSSRNFDVAGLKNNAEVKPRSELDLRHQRDDVVIERADDESAARFEVRLADGLEGRGVILQVRAVTDADQLHVLIPKRNGKTMRKIEELDGGRHNLKFRLLEVDSERPLVIQYPGATEVDVERVSVVELLNRP
ncbi:MAG: phytanoyl-CoA dioxygenase family protein [Acidimicrobiales bacterium]